MMAREGLSRVDEGDTPDFIFVNTCSVTEIADKKCRQLIRSYSRRYPKAHIVVAGHNIHSRQCCYLIGFELGITSGHDNVGFRIPS